MIGLITRPHGIKGELCVNFYADSLFLLKAPLILRPQGNEQKQIDIKISKYRQASNNVIIILPDCKDRNKAELYRNYEICIEAEAMREFLKQNKQISQDIMQKSEEEVYVHQLIGLEIYWKKAEDLAYAIAHNEDEVDEHYLGVLERIDFMAGQEIWVIKGEDEEEILLPAVEEFVEVIDIEEGEIIITPPQGLIELYLEPNEKDEKGEKEEN